LPEALNERREEEGDVAEILTFASAYPILRHVGWGQIFPPDKWFYCANVEVWLDP